MCSRLLVATVAVAGLAAACTSTERQLDVDGGASDVVVLGDVIVGVRPGQRVILRHAGKASPHAFVGGGDESRPLFARQAGGLVPNPTVWGASGDATWNGRSRVSTGAIRPGELKEITLADDIAKGEHVLSCALHSSLRIVLRVDGNDGPTPPDPDGVVATARSDVEDEAAGTRVFVIAGLSRNTAYVAAFSPRIAQIPVGGSVTWRASVRTPVDVVFGAQPSLETTVPPDGLPIGNADAWDGTGILRSGFLSAGTDTGAVAQQWTVTFTKPGTYRYASRFGTDMTGTIVVQP